MLSGRVRAGRRPWSGEECPPSATTGGRRAGELPAACHGRHRMSHRSWLVIGRESEVVVRTRRSAARRIERPGSCRASSGVRGADLGTRLIRLVSDREDISFVKLDSRAGSNGLRSWLTMLVRRKIRGMARLMSIEEELGASIAPLMAGGSWLMVSGGGLRAPDGELEPAGRRLRASGRELMPAGSRLMAPDARVMSSDRDCMSPCRRALDSVGRLKRGGVAVKGADGGMMPSDGRLMEGESDSGTSIARLGPSGHYRRRPCRATSMAGRRGKLGDNGMAVPGGRMKVSGRCGMKGAGGWG